jgi:phospholipid/cholesterol/gamma-HCH transport system substrate-binding protein
VERDAKYAAVAIFALLAIASAFAFVWWYSGKGDRRVHERYEIYFNGSVSGLAEGSPVRYLGVDVGRVENLSVDRANPGRVKILVEVDDTTPVSGATRARLGLLGLTGLLFIDLQNTRQPTPRSRSRKARFIQSSSRARATSRHSSSACPTWSVMRVSSWRGSSACWTTRT